METEKNFVKRLLERNKPFFEKHFSITGFNNNIIYSFLYFILLIHSQFSLNKIAHCSQKLFIFFIKEHKCISYYFVSFILPFLFFLTHYKYYIDLFAINQ